MTDDQRIDPTTDAMLSPRRRPHLFDSQKPSSIKGFRDAATSQTDGTAREHDGSTRGLSVDSVPPPSTHEKQIAALFVETNGTYFNLANVDPWGWA